jgi:hypothetical protein
MLNQIKRVADYVANGLKTKREIQEKSFKEFHEFHKWLLENIDPILWDKVDITVDEVNRYSLKLSIEDYKFWGETYATSLYRLMKLLPINKIKQKVFSKIIEVSKQCDVTNKKALDEVLKNIDDVYLSETK